MEVLIVGAGIVGVTAASTLAERGVKVVVLERGSVAGEASGLNAGVIGAGGWGDAPDIDVALKMGSRDLFVELAQRTGPDIGLDLTGTLTLVRTEDELTWASATVERERQAGRSLELLNPRELTELEPAVDPELLGALFDPLGARAEPVAATQAFAAEAISAGAVIETGRSVVGLHPLAGGGWQVEVVESADPSEASPERVSADVVVIAAGPWCAQLGAMVGAALPIVAVRGQMWASAPQQPAFRHAIAAAESGLAWSGLAWSGEANAGDGPPNLTHELDRRLTRHLYGRQRPNGEIVFGGDRVLTTDRVVDDDGIAVNHQHVGELLPLVKHLPVARTWSGLMPFSLDGRPMIGPIPGHDGLFVAGGLASSGFGRGPMTGRVVADLVMGQDPGFDVWSVLPGDRVGQIE